MAKKQTIFECQHCGTQNTKWIGKCPNCNSWDSFIEIKLKNLVSINPKYTTNNKALALNEVEVSKIEYFSSKEIEFDIVLGGGIVLGGLYLIGGSPGVGKSTLLLKTSLNLAKEKSILYVSGEENPTQIRLRAERLGKIENNLFLLNSIELEDIEESLKTQKYQICVIDSIQTMFSNAISSAPGSVSQVRECTFLLLRLAKELQISIFIIGHITKEGSIAGPRILEHMVDCVLYFEGDPSKELRILRSFKNRFGATNEVGIFEMGQNGLISAKNTSKMFFNQRDSMAGSAISVVLEGSRPIILEVQALVSESNFPKRSATGFEINRLNMLLALLERKLDFPFARYDVFINIVGGMKVNETAVDLAIIAAIISSYRNRPLNNKSAFIGEVSLIGDIREISNIDLRLKELASYGFNNAIIPKKTKNNYGLKIFEVSDVTKILQWM
ncbi:DNA repair protein RadA [Helicobacter sp. MIT 14-3879]|uniref:DNA repair protein RadA n=1 Tax=Helicobacter sp. MIT 14-3879 TaxID=2040649 RepID=UPI000E1E4CB0|nr:DNA repair protein RadA [Helicobacter sp. MIT 14-3879]RDU65075.1 DNA repair protein RadA [Helicobacter sp. MIT 14-3879]